MLVGVGSSSSHTSITPSANDVVTSSTCQPYGAVGDPCTGDAPTCAPGNYCDPCSGECATLASLYYVGEGQACDVPLGNACDEKDALCEPGLVCVNMFVEDEDDENDGVGVCRTPVARSNGTWNRAV